VLALQQAISLKMVGEVEEVLDDIVRGWNDDTFQLSRDTWVVFHADGRLIGYGEVADDGTPEVPYIDLYVHPDEWERDTVTMPYLLSWAETRARHNIARVPGDVRVAMRCWTHAHDWLYKRQLEDAGLTPIRQAFRMQIVLDTPPELPAMPDGFTLREATQDEDRRPILEAIRDAWRDHWGYVERPFDTHFAAWQRRWQEAFTPGAWLLAMDGRAIAGVCLCELAYNDDPAYGWIATLAVPRAYRRRGLATVLLRTAFARLYERGSRRIGLGVDADSLTGATRLYERAGMSVQVRFEEYEKVLRPGIDTTVHEAAG
jgi:ribosomal protein S18 acetylase RimI-like enzyme